MPIRIMHVVNNLGKGGLENGLVNLIERMDPTRFEHVVCTVRGLGPNLDRVPTDRVQVTCLADSGANPRIQTPALVRAIRRFEPDIVHSRNWGAIEAIVASRLTRVPVVHSEHGFEAAADAGEPGRRTALRRLLYHGAHRVLTVSHQLRDIHSRRTGFPASRIGVIHNGVDRARFYQDSESRKRVREEFGIREFCIGCVGNLLPVKDHQTILRAVDGLDAHGVDWRLLLIGEGDQRSALEAFVAAHPAWRHRVQFVGATNRVPELLRAMDVYVLPSLAEGICNSLLEAMATGLAVVATSVGGNPEVVVDRDSGLLFAAGDAAALTEHILQLRADRSLRKQLGQRAIQRVRNQFSIEAMVHAYEQLYSSLRPAAGVPALSAG